MPLPDCRLKGKRDMNGRLSWKVVLLAAFGMLLVNPANAGIVVTLDFTTGYVTSTCPISGTDNDCNRGTSLTLGNPGVVITARTTMGNITNPAAPSSDPFTMGSTGVVYWGDMGKLGDTCVSPSKAQCPGLGVRNAKGGGSEGISGGGKDQDEMIVFNWDPSLKVAPSSIILRLQGFKAADDETWVYLEFASNTNPSGPDYIFKWENLTTGLTLNFNTIAGLPKGEYVTKLGVLENAGHTGIGGITYEAVPEPAAFVLTGVPLLALGFLLRRRARKNQG